MSRRPRRRAVVRPTFSAAQLRPSTGLPVEDNSRERSIAAANAVALSRQIYLQHPAHRAMFASFDYIRALDRLSTGPKSAMRVIGASASGKSTGFDQYIEIDRRRSEPEPGTLPVFRIKLDRACTTKRLVTSMLDGYGDEYSDASVESTLRKRLYRCVERFRTEMIFVDEVQHLNFRASERSDPTDTLKRMLDDGVVSLVFGGDETALNLMNRNIQLANRMIAPGDINALSIEDEGDRRTFRSFVSRLDQELVTRSIMERPSNLEDDTTLRCLFVVSGGYLGRVVNLVRQAIAIAVRRSAPIIEPHDLWLATERWAIQQKIVSYNPFSKGIPDA
ncbi:TniB family NTP-binding protein [Sphingomonas sp.]|uniref:TniB family NTP-binding protein n=1 Tax=Sphingomonas sp. TaxID=28214 RepID=UPI0009FC55E8